MADIPLTNAWTPLGNSRTEFTRDMNINGEAAYVGGVVWIS